MLRAISSEIDQLIKSCKKHKHISGDVVLGLYIKMGLYSAEFINNTYMEYGDTESAELAKLYTNSFIEDIIFNNKALYDRGSIDVDIDMFINNLTEVSHFEITQDFDIDSYRLDFSSQMITYNEITASVRYTREIVPYKYMPLFIQWLHNNDDRILIGLDVRMSAKFKMCKCNFFAKIINRKKRQKYGKTIDSDSIKTLNFLLNICENNDNIAYLMTLIGSNNTIKVITYMSDCTIQIPPRRAINRVYHDADEAYVNRDKLEDKFGFVRNSLNMNVGRMRKNSKRITTAMLHTYFRSVFDKIDSATDRILKIVEKRANDDSLTVKELLSFYNKIQKDMKTQLEFYMEVFEGVDGK